MNPTHLLLNPTRLLPLLILLPLVGAVLGSVASPKRAKGWALAVSLLTLAAAVLLAANFDFRQGESATPGLTTQRPATVQITYGSESVGARATGFSLEQFGFRFSLGVDSISLWLVLLTTFLMPLALLSSFQSIQDRQKEYYAWMMVLLAAMLGVFIARDLLLFYVFFELTLVPMFFIIGIWGGPERRHAAGKFFLFTFAGSVFTLAAVIFLGIKAGRGGGASFDLDDVVSYAQTLPASYRYWLALGLLAGFAVKVPLFPVHTWLPLAHTEAPTAGSVILAGVLLKLGTYGLLRLALPIGLIGLPKPDGAVTTVFPGLLTFLGVLCVVGIIYGALVAWVQRDIKKLVAYSSVSHLGFCVLGLVALNTIGIQGSVLYMINHGLSTGALFLVIGMIYDRYHTRDINELSGLARRMPILAFFFVLFAMSSIGLPGLNGFVSEFLTILGAFTSDHLGAAFGSFAALGVILGAVYMLHMVARVIWGPLKTPALEAHGHTAHGEAHEQADQGQGAGQAADAGHGDPHGGHHADPHAPGDIGGREIAILVPLALAVILLGVMPSGVMRSILAPTQQLTHPQARARPAPRPTGLVEAPIVEPVAQR